MAKVLVTGGAGFIGSHTIRTLLDMGEEAINLDSFSHSTLRLPPTFLENMAYRTEDLLNGAQAVRASIQYRDGLRRQLLGVQPEYIIHLAALPSAATALQATEESFDALVLGTVNLLEVVRDLSGVKKFVYASSSMIYGDFGRKCRSGERRKDPKEIYGGMKLACEILVKVFCRRFGIPYAIVRPSAVYGPTNNNRSVLRDLRRECRQGGADHGDESRLDVPRFHVCEGPREGPGAGDPIAERQSTRSSTSRVARVGA